MQLIGFLIIVSIVYILYWIGKHHVSYRESKRNSSLILLSHLNVTWRSYLELYGDALEVGQTPTDTALFRSSGHPNIEHISTCLTDDVDAKFIIREFRLDLSILMTGFLMDGSQSYNSELMDDLTYALARLTELQDNIKDV